MVVLHKRNFESGNTKTHKTAKGSSSYGLVPDSREERYARVPSVSPTATLDLSALMQANSPVVSILTVTAVSKSIRSTLNPPFPSLTAMTFLGVTTALGGSYTERPSHESTKAFTQTAATAIVCTAGVWCKECLNTRLCVTFNDVICNIQLLDLSLRWHLNVKFRP